MLLYNIQFQPILLRPEDELPGVSFPGFEERMEAYVDDVVAVGEDETDLLIIGSICRQFELVSAAILKMYLQTAILGLGGCMGRETWALSWVSAPSNLKTFGDTLPHLGHPQSASLGRIALGGFRGPFRPGGTGRACSRSRRRAAKADKRFTY